MNPETAVHENVMDFAPSVAFIVSHTHWDREWYLTYHQFRTKLVNVVQRVLEQLEEESEFRHFLLDGQSIILEDYLAIQPQDASRIAGLVAQGALSLGPWYILPDEFLVSGESTVRNLMLGHEVAEELGGAQKVGYMPDSFGHIAQMPQILKRAGIDSFVYTRGSGDELDRLGHEFRWRAPDGSEVLAVNQCGGYSSAGSLGHREEWEAHTQRATDIGLAVQRVGELFEQMSHPCRKDVYLINNGCDHFPPQRNFTAILTALREAFPHTEFRHGSLAEFLAEVRKRNRNLASYEGELLGGKSHHILSGVWSARMYLKQENHVAQNLLSSLVEPFSAYMRFCHTNEYPSGLAEYSWKTLLENHPHDSICGCSTDEVHRQMIPRFSAVAETGEQILREHLVGLTPTFAREERDDRHTVLCVANTLPERRSEVVERLVVLQPFDIALDRLGLFDEAGNEVPCELIDQWFVDRFWGVDYRTELFGERQRALFQTYLDHHGDRIDQIDSKSGTRDCFLLIRFLAADLPPVGHVHYFLREREREGGGVVGPKAGQGPAYPGVSVTDSTLENEHVEVSLHRDGTFDVRDKASGHIFRGLNRLEDTEDVGDEYDYAPCAESHTVTSDGVCGVMNVVDGGGLRGCLEVDYQLTLPVAIEPDRTRRSRERVDCRVRMRVALRPTSPVVEVELQFNNEASDHRLRAQFPTGVSSETVVSDGHFYINHRPIDQPLGEDWKQAPAGTYPQQEFTLVQDGERGVALLNKGLPEIQAHRSETGGVTLSLTLIRAVGWLSRDDFDTRRRSNAGPTLYTPEAQCNGLQTLEYAVAPFVGSYIEADIKGLSQRYRTPVLTIQGVADQRVSGDSFLVQKAGRSTCVSAIKKHEVRDTLVVRLFNLTSEPVEEFLRFGVDIRQAWRVDLLEERFEALKPASDRELRVLLRPHEIATLEIRFDAASGDK